jgi:hypothetical protein
VSSRRLPALLCAAFFLVTPSPAEAVPEGMSPYLYGMHDDPGAELLVGPDGEVRGWITELRTIGTGGSCGAGDLDLSARAAQGYGTIMRLDADGTTSLPTDPSQYDGFAASFADCVARSRGIRVWIVGNEPNIAWGHVFAPSDYGEIYRRVLEAVDLLPSGGAHEVLFAPTAPWSSVAPWGDWDDGLAAAIDHVLSQGGRIDGVALHPYTREFSVEAIASDAWFPGRENKWHLHFRLYRDALALLRARDLLCIPIYITETGNACDPPCDPYPDLDLGYFVAMYDESALGETVADRHARTAAEGRVGVEHVEEHAGVDRGDHVRRLRARRDRTGSTASGSARRFPMSSSVERSIRRTPYTLATGSSVDSLVATRRPRSS